MNNVTKFPFQGRIESRNVPRMSKLYKNLLNLSCVDFFSNIFGFVRLPKRDFVSQRFSSNIKIQRYRVSLVELPVEKKKKLFREYAVVSHLTRYKRWRRKDVLVNGKWSLMADQSWSFDEWSSRTSKLIRNNMIICPFTLPYELRNK